MQRLDITLSVLLLLSAGTANAQSAATSAAQPLAPSQPPPAAPSTTSIALPVPVMSGPLSLSSPPPAFDAGPLGTWYVDGAFSALGLLQSHPGAGDRTAIADIGNAQVFLQKIDGPVRFYVQLGAYALPALGQIYAHETDASNTPEKFFDPVPQAFLKMAPSDAFSVQLGKLPTLIGDEYTFTFENVNIERGLLWNQEPAVSRGVQANYVVGPVGFSLSWNDGYYANRYTWLSGSASWTIDPASVLVFAAGANLGASFRNTTATPLDQNNGGIYNLIYTYTKGPLMLSPYLQYSTVPADGRIGIGHAASLYGGAVLASYAVSPAFTLGARIEAELSTGASGAQNPTNLLYGPDSGATSLTVTPTYTHGRWFVRLDLSALAILNVRHGDGLGRDGDSPSQLRSFLEAGYVF